MKTYIFFLSLMCFFSCSSHYEETRYYYPDGKLFMIRTTDKDKLSVYDKSFYENGQLYSEGETKYSEETNDWLYFGYWKYFFLDGFPKEAYTCVKGTDISPRETGIYSGYDIKMDMGETIKVDSFWYCPVRFFVDGVSRYHYKVVVRTEDNKMYVMRPYPKKIENYVIRSEDGDVLDTVSMDETMYDYLMPAEWLDDIAMPVNDGTVCMKFEIHFPNTSCHYTDSIYQTTSIRIRVEEFDE